MKLNKKLIVDSQLPSIRNPTDFSFCRLGTDFPMGPILLGVAGTLILAGCLCCSIAVKKGMPACPVSYCTP